MARAHRSITKDPAKAFISTWDTAIVYTGSTANNQIRLPLISTGTYRFTVQWGDNTSNLITSWNQAEVLHTYPAPGTYTVTITGFIKGWDFSGFAATTGALTGDRRKITSVTQFGCLRLVTYTNTTTLAGAFYGCINLNLSGVTDYFNFKGTTSVFGLLRDCRLVSNIPNLNKWDVSKITIFRLMLREMVLFDQNIGNWNVSKGQDFLGVLSGNSALAPYGSFTNGGSSSIGNWDMSSATNLQQMFFVQRFFNHNIGSWNVSNVTNMSFMFNTYQGVIPVTAGQFNNGGSDSIKNWNTGNVTTMNGMFSGAAAFNQPIGIWNTSKVTNMSYMLQARIFNQPINNWDTSKVTNMSRMLQIALDFNQPINNWSLPLVTDMINFMYFSDPLYLNITFSKQNYSDFLINLASQTLQPNVSIRVNQFYSPAAVAARAVLTSAPNNWTVVDLGVQP